MKAFDVLVIGAGPAGLAAAIRLKTQSQSQGKALSVAVLDKASRAGRHTLSGAVMETACLDELVPGWQDEPLLSGFSRVKQDELYFLTSGKSIRVPSFLVPEGMHHQEDLLIPAVRLVEFLSMVAVRLGVEVYHGFSASELLWDKNCVRGVRLVDLGRNKSGVPKENFLKGEEIEAGVTLLADGSRGVLSREFIARHGQGRNPQVYSIGIKQVLRLPARNTFGESRVVHTLGFPSKPDVFGGGFFYSMQGGMLSAGLILGLDWKHTDFNPQKEFEILKTHPLIAGFLEGAQVVASGAKVIPEGGFFSMPNLVGEGALLLGDAAGLVNMEKIKGLHYAILSGMAAADAVIHADLAGYPENLAARGVMKDMHHARNFRAVFQFGTPMGAPLSKVQSLLPFRVPMGEDHAATRRGAKIRRSVSFPLDRAVFASLSNTAHREDEPAHLIITDPARCLECAVKFEKPCTLFCPVEVYRSLPEGVSVSPSNCVHCGTCVLKCPLQNIRWVPPEGGEGPRYKIM